MEWPQMVHQRNFFAREKIVNLWNSWLLAESWCRGGSLHSCFASGSYLLLLEKESKVSKHIGMIIEELEGPPGFGNKKYLIIISSGHKQSF